MFIRERFKNLTPKPINFLQLRKLRGLRWSKFRLTTRKTLKKEIDNEKNFVFRPYSYTPRRISDLQFLEEVSGLVKLRWRERF